MGRQTRPTEPIDLPEGVAHGTGTGYRRGCGCTGCRAAKARDHHRVRGFKAQQLGLFAEAATAEIPLRRVKAKVPEGLDLDAVAAAMVDPEGVEGWETRARCRGRSDLAALFHAEIIAQVRDDGTISYSAPGDYVPDHWQDWCRQGCPVWAQCVAAGLRHETTRYRIGYWGSTPAQRVHIHSALRTRKATA